MPPSDGLTVGPASHGWVRRLLAGSATHFVVTAVLLTLVTTPGCRRGLRVGDETYRQAVTAFYVSLAAMQTSQDVLARQELDRLIQLVPEEPAGWANLGLLLLRQQQFDEAAGRLARAAELAPRSAHIERLRALTESRTGNLESAIRHWRRAIDLDRDNPKAAYALAQDLERLGGPESEAEAQRLFGSIAGNLAAGLEHARIAARRGDAAALAAALEALAAQSRSWPPEAQERFTAVRDASQANPVSATTPVIFLKNVLLREPAYRAALAEVSTPHAEVGDPIVRLIALPNPEPRPAPADEQLAFSTEASPAVSAPGTLWAGMVWLTGDARPTPFAVTAGELRLGDSLTQPFPGAASESPDAVAAADLNGDFRIDLVLAGVGGLQILRQAEDGGFAPATHGSTLGRDVTGAAAHAAWPADVDTDGDLDLVFARRDGGVSVLRNNGDDTFAEQAPFGALSRVRGFAWADLDGEGVPDAAFLDDQGVVRIFLNLRGGEFRELEVPDRFPRAAAITAAEVSGDGVLDLLAVAVDGTVTSLERSAGSSAFEGRRLARVDPPAGLAAGSARLLVADLDNNGAGDLVISTPAASAVLLAGPHGAWRAAAAASLPGGITAAADLDGDGRLELVGRGDDGPRVVQVKGQKSYRWQAIRPRAVAATGDQRINSFGIGGEVEVRTGLHAQKQVIMSPVVHFGLGEAAGAEVARITWPNGVLQSEFDLAADASIGASQRLKGSCPWLFAWNGTAMGFVTDFIWRSPLGLRINAQATADVQMTQDWVRIRRDQLAPRNGEYDLRITAELWETHFFDLVSLLVVDHPEDTEVFVDERFAVPPPEWRVIATAPVQELAGARDDQGRDVRDLVRARDDRHLDFAGRGRYQGVTREHYVELELPDSAPRSGPLWLVAQGWVHPTDSSINVALGQGSHPPPTGLSLQVADASGRFRTVRSGLGFPAGKDKTILIDLAGVSPRKGPRRLRLGTNLEIFWDRLGWATGRPDAGLELRQLQLKAADLRFRGYSVTEQKDASTPERPRYVVGGTAPRWRDLDGYHTRFGDVRELLVEVDDRYVIMNAGDELRVTFPEAPPPPAGFVRDFVLVGDGWEKDGDYNTVASRTVLPLPAHGSAAYIRGNGRLEDDPVYRRYPEDFQRYHTRYVSPETARDALRVKIEPSRP
ncbi:MAG TPA: FG-GAP-like repeat-containing protein [Vicinamibacterales bacterium]|nr:FG-GAP-like repeat-containing protein [Vicinamibacterales bacterium]